MKYMWRLLRGKFEYDHIFHVLDHIVVSIVCACPITDICVFECTLCFFSFYQTHDSIDSLISFFGIVYLSESADDLGGDLLEFFFKKCLVLFRDVIDDILFFSSQFFKSFMDILVLITDSDSIFWLIRYSACVVQYFFDDGCSGTSSS